MKETKDTHVPVPSRSAAIWLSALPLFMGGFITGIGLQWIPHDPATIHAPYWVIVVAGLMFISAGFVVLSTAFNHHPGLQTAFGLVILVGLTLISNWVAFGPGERHFTGASSFNGVRIASGPVNEGHGRLLFGIGSVVLDLVLVAMLVKLCRQRSD